MKLYLAQMTSEKNIQRNLSTVEEFARRAAAANCDMLILPEMFAQFGDRNINDLALLERQFEGPVGGKLRELALEYGLWIVAGTVPVDADDGKKPKARCHVLDSSAQLVAQYDKIHLFDAQVGDSQGQYRESDSYSHGESTVVFDSPWGKIGLAVCYDLRFAELFLKLNEQGAQLVVLPSAFTYKTGQQHWDTLVRARAIENGYFIAGVNQTGQHDEKRRTWGHSQLVHPDGRVETLAEDMTGLVVSVDFSELEAYRSAIPVNQHRRL